MTDEERKEAKKHFDHGLYQGIDFCVSLFTGYLPCDADDAYRRNIVTVLVKEFNDREEEIDNYSGN